MKKPPELYRPPRPHWVGDGFPVRTLFAYADFGARLSPFLLLDFAGPDQFKPAERPRGVEPHPHRGFETVTIVYRGEVAHRDSTGHGGTIGPGDVQWMTAGAGILHEEFHSAAFTLTGGMLEMVQLWVNLPAAHKMSPPAYQAIPAGAIPVVELPDHAGTARVIAGEFAGVRGPAHTFSPLRVLDLRLVAGGRCELPLAAGWNTALAVLRGTLSIDGAAPAGEAQLVVPAPGGTGIAIEAGAVDATAVLLSGEPLDEPIAGHGPFVMNTRQEIEQAITDYHSGRFGRMDG